MRERGCPKSAKPRKKKNVKNPQYRMEIYQNTETVIANVLPPFFLGVGTATRRLPSSLLLVRHSIRTTTLIFKSVR